MRFRFKGFNGFYDRREGPEAIVEVRDEGPGIPDGELPRVWDRLSAETAAAASEGWASA